MVPDMHAGPKCHAGAPSRTRSRTWWLLCLTLLLSLACPGISAAGSPPSSYARRLDEIELRLRFGIELGPAELDQDIGFSERLCLAAQTAEDAAETPAAETDWRGLNHIVRRDDLRLTRSIEATLHGADRRVRDLGERFTKVWRGKMVVVKRLHNGAGEVRGGILRLLTAMDTFRIGFGQLLAHNCHRAEVVIAEASGPIARGLVRINSGMGLLWLLAEPDGN
jgi:hypothetical protein